MPKQVILLGCWHAVFVRMKDDLGLKMSLADLGSHHMDVNMDIRGLVKLGEGILTILELEEQRYHEMLRKGEAAVNTALAKLPKDAKKRQMRPLFRLAEERGLQPDMVASIAKRLDGRNSPSVLDSRRIWLNVTLNKPRLQPNPSEVQVVSGDWPATIRSYYDDTTQTQFEATVLHCEPIDASSLNLSSEVIGCPYTCCSSQSHPVLSRGWWSTR